MTRETTGPTGKPDDHQGIRVRSARDADAMELARLAGELGYPTEAAEMRRRLALLEGRTDHAVFVAERERPDGGMLGWIHVGCAILLESGESAEVLGLVVDPRGRRSGTGRMLVAAAEAWGRTLGLGSIVVRSNAVREEAHRFYPAIGYCLAKTQRVYSKPLGGSAGISGSARNGVS